MLRVPLTRDHLSVISGITLTRDLFLDLPEHAYDADGVVGFLSALLEQIVGHITVIWDGAPIPRSHVVKEFLRDGAAHRLHLEQLSGYAPDLHPDEGIWNYLKRVELSTVCCHDLAELTRAGALRRATPVRQAGDYPRLFPPMRLLGLEYCHDISSVIQLYLTT